MTEPILYRDNIGRAVVKVLKIDETHDQALVKFPNIVSPKFISMDSLRSEYTRITDDSDKAAEEPAPAEEPLPKPPKKKKRTFKSNSAKAKLAELQKKAMAEHRENQRT